MQILNNYAIFILYLCNIMNMQYILYLCYTFAYLENTVICVLPRLLLPLHCCTRYRCCARYRYSRASVTVCSGAICVLCICDCVTQRAVRSIAVRTEITGQIAADIVFDI